MDFSNESDLPAFSVTESQSKISLQFRLTTSHNHSFPDDGFRLLVSSNPLLRFRLGVSQDFANSVSHHPIYYTGSNEPRQSLKFNKPDNTYPLRLVQTFLFY
jgi:hypothetical protein